jgi:hypothetical protein
VSPAVTVDSEGRRARDHHRISESVRRLRVTVPQNEPQAEADLEGLGFGRRIDSEGRGHGEPEGRDSERNQSLSNRDGRLT